jgi:hypothetical protein
MLCESRRQLLLFGSEMVGAVRGKDPATGQRADEV